MKLNVRGLLGNIEKENKKISQEESIETKEKRGVSGKNLKETNSNSKSNLKETNSSPSSFTIVSTPSGLRTRNAPRAGKAGSVAAPTKEKRKRRTKAEMEEYRKTLENTPKKVRTLSDKTVRAREEKARNKTVRDTLNIPSIIYDSITIGELLSHGDKVSIPSPTFDSPESRFKHRTEVIFDKVQNGVVYVLYAVNERDTPRSIPMKFGIYDFREQV